MSMPSDVTSDVSDAMEAGTRRMAGSHSRLRQVSPEVAGFAAAAFVTFLGIAVVGPRLLSLRRSTSAHVHDLQRRAREARYRADRAAAQAQAALRAAADHARAAGRQATANAKAGGRDARARAQTAGRQAQAAASTAGDRLRQLGGGTIRARWK